MLNRHSCLCFLLVIAFVCPGCLNKLSRKVGSNIRAELVKSNLDSVSKSLARQATAGALEVVLSDSVQARIRTQLDSIGRQLDKQAGLTTSRLRDSILSRYTEVWLQKALNIAGENIQSRGNAFLDNIRGAETLLLVAKIRNELLNDTTLQRAGLFRDELLGNNTHILIDSLAQKVTRGLFANQINPNTAKLINNVKKAADERISNFKRLAIIAGIIALLIGIFAFWIYRDARKHKQTLKIITKQIDNIPDQSLYDHLVNAIRKETETKGLEPHLQQILKEQHLYQQEDWKNKDFQVLNLMGKYLNYLKEDKAGNIILHNLTEEAKKVNLDTQLNSLIARTYSYEDHPPA